MRKLTSLSVAAAAVAILMTAGCSSGGPDATPDSDATGGVASAVSAAGDASNVSSAQPDDALAAPSVAASDSGETVPTSVTAPGTSTDTTAPSSAPVVSAQVELPPDVQSAIESARAYLNYSSFSKKGLIHQLSSPAGDGYDEAIAAKAVGQLNVDWNEQAVEAAKNYLSFSSFSKTDLIHQLESAAGDQFTHEQAVYGVSKAYDGSAGGDDTGASEGSAELTNAIASAKDYLSYSAFSAKGLIHQLSSAAGDSYPEAVAAKAVGQLDVDWNEQAVEAAKSYLSFSSFSKSELIHQLESAAGDQFTHEQAVHGATVALGG